MTSSYKIIVKNEDGENIILKRDQFVADKKIDVLYIKTGFSAQVQLQIGAQLDILKYETYCESELNKNAASVEKNSSLTWIPDFAGFSAIESKITLPDSINWIFAVQDEDEEWIDSCWQTRTDFIPLGAKDFGSLKATSITIDSDEDAPLGVYFWLEPYFKTLDFKKRNSIYGLYIMFFEVLNNC